jgi:glycosyltransferase involved in cell wall biosynthesis
MRGKVLVVGIKLKTYGGHTRFVDGLLGSGLPYDFVHFNPARPPKDKSVSLRRAGYHELLDAGLGRAALGAAITLYHLLVFPFILLRERPTVVHLAGSTFWQFWEFAFYILACRVLGRKSIYHWLASYVDFHQRSGKLGLTFLRIASRMADRHIVQSSIDHAYLTKLVPASRVDIVPNGIPAAVLAQYADRTAPTERQEIRLLFVGGRDPVRKGLGDILKALETVLPVESGIRLAITGGGNVTETLTQVQSQLVQDHLDSLGYVSEAAKMELYRSSDVLLLPSYEEGLPYVILEGMGAGLPVISTRIGGIPDVIENQVNGFLIEPGDVPALAERILRLCRDPELRRRVGQANRQKIATSYTEEAIFSRIAGIYDALAAGRLDNGSPDTVLAPEGS